LAEQPKQLTITEQIDVDEGLKSKRKLLTVTSLILSALSFSGAKVEEANTFVLRLSFENQHGVSVLLVLAVIFLLIRYHNYAYPYHQQLYQLWTKRLLANPFFLSFHPHESESYGLIVGLSPKGMDIDGLNHENIDWGVSYKCSFLIIRKLRYSWYNRYEDYQQEVLIGWNYYLKVIYLEARYRFNSYIKHRESLDILTPYILGALAISSYFFNDQLQALLKMLAVN